MTCTRRMSVSTVSDIVRTRNVSVVMTSDLRRNDLSEPRKIPQAKLSCGFEGQSVFPFRIACLAARHEIAFGRFSAAHDWHQMVHSQLSRRNLFSAVIADPGGSLALPPSAFAQFARSLSFPTDLFFRDFD